MMRSSKRRNVYSNRRRRRGKNTLYTRFRCDPDPWNGSPPKTPPSSDDEANETEYAMSSTLPLGSNYTRSSTETVAPAPANIANRHHRNNNRNRTQYNSHYNGDRLNEVKRKLSKYVKMENANVLQCHQFTQKQTKLNVRKTAPVPLPSTLNKKVGKTKQKQNKQKKQKQKQKQTAPAPKPPLYILQQKQSQKQLKQKSKSTKSSSSKQAKCNKIIVTQQNKKSVEKKKEKENVLQSTETAAFKMRAFAEPFIPCEDSTANEHKSSSNIDEISPSNDELIDFASIPEAYYVGYDNDVIYPQNRNKKEEEIAIANTNDNDINIGEVDVDKDDICSFSANSTPNSSYEHFVMSDFTNSDYSPITSASSRLNDSKKNTEKNHQIVLKEINTNVMDENIHNIDEDEVYFNDDKFALLAEQILDEDPTLNENELNSNYMNMKLNSLNMKQYNAWNDTTAHNQHQLSNNQITNNIWAEPQTLGGLLMNGLPPISTTQLFQQ